MSDVAPDQYITAAAHKAISVARDSAASIEDRAAAVGRLLQHGLLEDAREALAAIGPSPETAGHAAFADRLLAGEAIISGLLNLPTPRKCSSLMVAPCQGAAKCIVVFSGIALEPYPTLPAFAQVQDCHLIFLFDPSRRFLLARTPRLGADYHQTCDTLRRIIGALGAPAVFCAGISSGGYPALRIGLELGASGILLFSGPTTVDMADDPGAPMSDYPQLAGIYRSVPHMAIGMAGPYDAADPRPSVILIFGEAHRRDRFMAHLLADRVSPERGVSLWPLADFAAHDTFTEIMRRGEFPEAIERLLALRPVSDKAK